MPGTLWPTAYDNFRTDYAPRQLVESSVHNTQFSSTNAIQRELKNRVANVKHYGAVGDGVANDNAAIALAIAALVAVGGGVLYFPRGTYLYNSLTITISNVTIQGEGRGVSKLKQAAVSNQSAVLFASGTGTIQNCAIIDIEVDGSAAQQTAHVPNPTAVPYTGAAILQNGVYGVAFRDCYGVTVRDCYIHDVLNSGIQFNQTGDVKCLYNTLDNTGMSATLQDAVYGEPRNAISIIAKPTNVALEGDGYRIIGNRIKRVVDIGIDLHGSGSTEYVVSHNIIKTTQTAGQASSSTHWGISVEIESGEGQPGGNSIITENILSDIGQAIAIHNAGSTTQGFDSMIVANNKIRNCSAVASIAGTWLTFEGNVARSCGVGITTNDILNGQPVGTHGHWIIRGNQVDINASAFGAAGFFGRLQPGVVVTDVLLEGNIFSGPGTSGIHNTSAGIYIEGDGWSEIEIGPNECRGFLNGINIGVATVHIVGGKYHHNNDSGIIMANTSTPNTGSSIVGAFCSTNGQNIQAYGHGITLLRCSGTTVKVCTCVGNSRGLFVDTLASGITAESNKLTGNVVAIGNTVDATRFQIIRNNEGHNPIGNAMPQPAVPASGITATSFYDAMVRVAGGTVTQLTIGGVNTGDTSGWVRVPARQTLAITYSVAPTWTWWAD